jgi:hypothetical protein
MFIGFVTGVCIGFAAGLIFYHWWIRPDIQDLKKHIARLEQDKKLLSKLAMRTFTVTRTKVNIDNK